MYCVVVVCPPPCTQIHVETQTEAIRVHNSQCQALHQQHGLEQAKALALRELMEADKQLPEAQCEEATVGDVRPHILKLVMITVCRRRSSWSGHAHGATQPRLQQLS